MWKEALLKTPAQGGEGVDGTKMPEPHASRNQNMMTPDQELRSNSPGSTMHTPGSVIGANGGDIPPVEFFMNLRSTKAGSTYGDGASVTSTEFTFRSKGNASMARSESWADDDDDFLESLGMGAGRGAISFGGVIQPKKKAGPAWKEVNSGPSQRSGQSGPYKGEGKVSSRHHQDGGRKGRGAGGGGGGDGSLPQSAPQPQSNGRFDALGSAGSWRR